MDPRFAHVQDWIFDLDNCLYPAGSRLFDLIDQRMTAYIERLLGVDAIEARRVQKMHFHGSGTTLAGLMKHHAVDPHHFMGDVHDIPLDRLDSAATAAAASRKRTCEHDRAAGRRQEPVGHCQTPLKPLKTHGFPGEAMVYETLQFA